jgi:non-specific serine/threonine protein kinase
MDLRSDHELRFGRLTVRPSQRQVLVDDRPLALGARALDVLLMLIENRHRVVTKEELLDAAWRGLVVEENNLQVQISALRKALGPASITTVPARGYQFTLAQTQAAPAEAVILVPQRTLPPEPSAFIGREDDLAELQSMLGQTRMLTLTGIGGCGKTRLALQLARRVWATFTDGVRYVDLAPLQDADRLALTVAATFGLGEDGASPIVERLCRHLADKNLLLVIDNCEHLASATTALVQAILTEAPRASVLATSREGLSLPGERLVSVRSLRFPAAGASTRDEVAQHEAVRLFVDRAQAVAPRFQLDDHTALPVADICRRLDGIPLAIELAAARMKVLSVQEIRARLDDRFRLLIGGSRNIGRQQTLLATIQWSHDQLAPEERQSLRRLSVFAGGWSLEAAVAVAGEGADEYAVLDVLSRLADHSLIATQTNAAGVTRYGMLESVRMYALERLGESGEAISTRDRHLTYFLRLAETTELELEGEEGHRWQALLGADFENLLAALAWCDHAEDGARRGLELIAAMRAFLSESGLYLLGETLTSQALARPGAERADLVRCRALLARAFLVFFLGRYAQSMADAQASLVIARRFHDDDQVAFALWIIGFDHLADGRLPEARATFEQSLELARNSRHTTRVLIGLAEIARVEGNLDRARALNEEVLALQHERGDLSGMVISHGNLTMIALCLDDIAGAADHLRNGLALAEVLDGVRPRIAQLFCAAGLAAAQRDWHRAARCLGAMHGAREPMNFHIEPADVGFVDSVARRTQDAIGIDAFAAEAAAGRSLPLPQVIAELRAWLRLPPGATGSHS